ncbi:MAG: hypothetical protein N2376_07655 [Clostridia bacterium]|nr:hypothetical protein [Clostridia bacterium]
MRKRHIFSIGILLALSLVIGACSMSFQASYSSSVQNMSGSFTDLSGDDSKEVTFKKAGTYTLSYETSVQAGNLKIELLSPQDEVILILDSTAKGDKELSISKGDTYKLKVTADHAKGRYNLKFKLK